MALDIVSDYLADARRLLQDRVAPYRYPDEDLVAALNAAVLEARRIRSDIFMVQARTGTLPSFSTAALSAAVPVDHQYRMAFVYYIVGRAALSDEEENEDARATVFMNKFVAQLLSVQS
jgi:hypothetical protein